MHDGVGVPSGQSANVKVAKPPVKLVELVEVVTLKNGSETAVTGSGAPRAQPIKKVPGQGGNADVARQSTHQYINQAKEQSGENHPHFGRKIEFRARIDWKGAAGASLANKKVQFSYELTKGVGRPTDVKIQAADKEGFGNQTTKVVQTDADGWTGKVEFTVSHYGGDKIKVVAQADETNNNTYAGPKLKTGDYQVWRKVFAQLTYNKNATIVSRAKTISGFNEVFLEYNEIDEKKFDKTTVVGLVEHPLYQFKPPKTNTNKNKKVVCVGSHNKTKFTGLLTAATDKTKPKAHLILCDVQWDPLLGPLSDYDFKSKSKTIRYKNAAGNKKLGVFDPPLTSGASLVPANSSSWKWNDGTKEHKGKLATANVSVEDSRDRYYKVKVTLPTKCPTSCCNPRVNIVPTATKKAEVKLQLNAASGPWAGESGGPTASNPHCLIVINADEDKFNNTILHEIGHLFKQTRAKTTSWRGIPKHADYYIKRGGQGNHCKKGATEHATKKDQDGNKAYQNGTCLMFHIAVGNVKFCDNCKQDMRLRDLTDFFKD